MKNFTVSNVTPQDKLIGVNNKFGNPALKKQQGSTIEVYDGLQLDEATLQYEFFIDAKTRQFPFTNLTDGKLQPQESFILERAYFTIMTQDDITGDWIGAERLDLTTYPGLALGEIEFFIENQRVLKKIPLRSFFPEFNKAADSDNDAVFEFDTQIALIPQLQFRALVKFPKMFFANVANQTSYIFMTLGGAGALFSPKNKY